MAFFGLSDISFNKGTASRKGPLGPLVSSQYEGSTLRYPLDVGNFDKGHYVVFFVREQKESSFKTQSGYASEVGQSGFSNTGSVGSKNIANILNNPQSLATNFGNELMGKINSGLNQLNSATGGAINGITSQISKAAGGAIGGIVGSINSGISNIFGQAGISFGGSSAQTSAVIDNSIKRITNRSFIQTTRLTKDAIALYMPDTVMFNYSQSYSSVDIGKELAGMAAAAGRSAVEASKEGGAEGAASSGVDGKH